MTSHEARPPPPLANFDPLCELGLSRRECEVLAWVAQGKRNADIATILGISAKTVGKHVEHLLAKLHAENRTAAVFLAREQLRLWRDRKAETLKPAGVNSEARKP